MSEEPTKSGADAASADPEQEPVVTLPLGEKHRRIIFYEMIKAEMNEGVLRFSKRRQLLRYARKIGIPEFEASLMIAKIQYSKGMLEAPRILTEQEILEKLQEANQANALMRRIVIASAAAIVSNIWIVHLFF